MKGQLIDGVKISQGILDQLSSDINNDIAKGKRKPGLAVVLVGDNPASKAYVGRKKKACEQVGIQSFEKLFPVDVEEQELIDHINELNNNKNVDGILVQMPLPEHLDEQKLLELILPEKDVDGFHPVNVGKTLLGLPSFKSCTPYGILKLLSHSKIDTKGKHVVVLGRSNIVGKPMASMLVQYGWDATVTICHSKTEHLEKITSQADILIAAIGKPYFVSPDMVKEDAIVIDVGINRVEDNESKRGYRLVGDVDFDSVKDKTSHITPVPGGVGPMTIAMLLTNTYQAFKSSF